MVDSAFEPKIPVQLSRRVSSGERDARGNERSQFLAPVELLVWSWQLTELAADSDGHASRTTSDASCSPAKAERVAVGDRIELPGEGWFRVVSTTDYDNNPLWSPGLADVKLRRVDG
ncbi:hypothetical protein [Rhodococcus koreensis]|uniref:hypothetical protein n=1 Tax=Rhodococcus koreensis TaxID=99653 RepID=UPI0036DC5130